jgi:hypothetical protein
LFENHDSKHPLENLLKVTICRRIDKMAAPYRPVPELSRRQIGKTMALCLLMGGCSPEQPKALPDDSVQVDIETLAAEPGGSGGSDISRDAVPVEYDGKGHQIAKNEEYGITAVFPTGISVCYAQSGGHAHGFFSRFGGQAAKCGYYGTLFGATETAFGIWADGNSDEARVKRTDECIDSHKPQSAPIHVLKNLTLPGRFSLNCQAKRPDGSIDIFLFTQSKPRKGGVVPAVFYKVWLSTHPHSYKRDLRQFREFLSATTLEYSEASEDDGR